MLSVLLVDEEGSLESNNANFDKDRGSEEGGEVWSSNCFPNTVNGDGVLTSEEAVVVFDIITGIAGGIAGGTTTPLT